MVEDIKILPAHIAIIMDGNGRWAQKRNLRRVDGHKKGIEVLRRITEYVYNKKISYLTVFSFSKENWKRPKEEVDFLMELMKEYLLKEKDNILNKNIRLKIIGDRNDIPENLKTEIEMIEEKTKNKNGLTLTLAFSYSARDEIVRGAIKLVEGVLEGKIRKDDINENLFNSMLDTHDLPPPDLLIRTGGEIRLSNFLLWEIAYSELYFTPVLWPDFTEKDLEDALRDYASRERRYGMTSEQIRSLKKRKI